MSTQDPFSENPYRAPPDNIPNEYQDVPSRKGTLGWVLFSFKGRIPRLVFWVASIGIIGIALVFFILCTILVGGSIYIDIGITKIPLFSGNTPRWTPASLGGFLVMFILLNWIYLAIQVKRWHDRGKSGWWVFINVLPYVGALWSFVELGCLRGDHGQNQYGADPT